MPRLSALHNFLYRSYNDLRTERQVSMGGVSNIPWSAIRDYGLFYEVEEIEQFIVDIRTLDIAYLLASNKKQQMLEAQNQVHH